jgi:hypothetical protein
MVLVYSSLLLNHFKIPFFNVLHCRSSDLISRSASRRAQKWSRFTMRREVRSTNRFTLIDVLFQGVTKKTCAFSLLLQTKQSDVYVWQNQQKSFYSIWSLGIFVRLSIIGTIFHAYLARLLYVGFGFLGLFLNHRTLSTRSLKNCGRQAKQC